MERLSALTLCISVLAFAVACKRQSTSGLKGQANTTLTFYAKAVDQAGAPLANVRFQYRVEAYPDNWSFETRDRPNRVEMVDAVSDAAGNVRISVTGCELILLRAELNGYRHLHETLGDDSNMFFRLIAWSDLWYKTDADHPAIYVFVKDGVREVSVLPCKGGYDSANGTHWMLNKPNWPEHPSLSDVKPREAMDRSNERMNRANEQGRI
jgi:hypothetical protein